MEQNALAVFTGSSKTPIYTEIYRCYETYRFYRFTDLQALYDFSDFWPTRARARSTTRSVAAAQERWQERRRSAASCNSGALRRFVPTRARARSGGAAGREIGCGGAGLRSCREAGPAGAMGRFWHTIFLRVQVSSRVAAILITLTLRVVEVELEME